MKLSYLKWILMLLGAMRFRMYGAFIGYFVGLFLEELMSGRVDFFIDNPFASKTKEEEKIILTSFQKSLVHVVAGLLQVHNFIPKEQGRYVLKYFYRKFGTKQGQAMYELLKLELKQSTFPVQEAANLRIQLVKQDVIDLLGFFIGLCSSGKGLYPNDRKLLEEISYSLGLSKQEFDLILGGNGGQERRQEVRSSFNSIDISYEVLGLSKSASEKELKAKYRSLVLKYHPDKTTLDAKLAAKKFQEVHEAYHRVRESRGMK